MFHVFVANHCSGHARVAPPRRISGARGMDSIAPEGCCVIRTPLGNESKLYAPTRVESREKTSVRGVLDSLVTPARPLGAIPLITRPDPASGGFEHQRVNAPPLEIEQQLAQPALHSIQVQIMAKASLRIDPGNPRLRRIDFPGVEIENRRLAVDMIDPPQEPP